MGELKRWASREAKCVVRATHQETGPCASCSSATPLRGHLNTLLPLAVDLLTRADEWKLDLAIHENTEFAGALVVVRSGARNIVHGLGLMPSERLVWGRC